MGVKLDNGHWYERVPKLLEISREGKATKLWNKPVQTDRTVRKNKPDIIICDKKNMYDNRYALSAERNVIKKKA